MKRLLKNSGILLLALALVVSTVQSRTARAAVKKKAVTITLKGGQMTTVEFSLSDKVKSKKAGTKIYVKIAKMKGNPISVPESPNDSPEEEPIIPIDTWGDYCDAGLFYGYMKDFKVGKTYIGCSAINEYGDFYTYYGKGKLVVQVPWGVTSITYKITFSSNSNQKNIKKITIGKMKKDENWHESIPEWWYEDDDDEDWD